MLAFAHQHPHWTDFPNGLRVLVVDTDTQLLAHLKSKLEAFNYVATTFCSSGEAVVALQNRNSVFHAALVEASAENDVDGWKVLEAATHLPVIMMSSIENMDIMMKSLACGACEFLQKPLSDETLKNIWQHVVRKALCTGEPLLPDNFWPTKNVEVCSTRPQSEAGVTKLDTSETNRTESPLNGGRRLDSLMKVKVEFSIDDVEPVNLFIHEDEGSTLFDITPGSVAEACYLSCETFASRAVTLQLDELETSASQENTSHQSPGLHDFVSMKTGMNEEFPQYQSLFHVNSEPEDVSDGSSADVSDFLGTNMEEQPVGVDDMDTSKSKYCSNLQVNEELELDGSFGDITLNSESGMDGNTLSSSLDGLGVSEGEELKALRQDTNCLDEEALLLQEVKRAERDLARNTTTTTSEISIQSAERFPLHRATAAASHSSDPQESGKGSKGTEGKRRMKVDWTPELHRRFVQAVEQLGVDKAIPSRILEIMGVQCLTRHNIASHLQKYRSHRKQEAASWNQRRRSSESSTRPRPPSLIMPLPSIQGHLTSPQIIAPPLHVWGHPTVDHSQMHAWQKPLVSHAPVWRTTNGTMWQQACIDTWGRPAPAPAPGMPCYAQPTMLTSVPGVAHMTIPVLLGDSIFESVNAAATTRPSPKETVNAAIDEVLSNPCTPLPLGLKPPSLESVINELQRQGICTFPSVPGVITR